MFYVLLFENVFVKVISRTRNEFRGASPNISTVKETL
mgnify:CR=1|jgi:hypothetical protein